MNRRESEEAIVANPVEEQLIMTRFPEWQEKWIGPKLRHHTPPLVQKIRYAPQMR